MPATESGADYFIAQAAPAGSPLYYACLLTEPAARPPVLALHTLENELLKSLTDIQDPGVARLRLQWWIEEIDRAGRGQARHPLGQLLQHHLATSDVTAPAIGAAIAALESEIGAGSRTDFSTLLHEYRESYGRLWALSGRLAGLHEAADLDACAELGALHHMNRTLQDLPLSLARGLARPLPYTEMRDAAVSADLPLSDEAWQPLLAAQFQRLHERLEQARHDFPPTRAPRMLHGLILVRLDAVLCRAIQADGCRLAQQRYALTPLRRLWLAWRCRRQVMRRARAHQ